MSLSSGAKLGPYEVVGPLGADGMGEVYRAHDALLVLSGRMVGNSSITGLWNCRPDSADHCFLRNRVRYP